MKGTADKPRCGFSNAVVQILNFHGVDKFDHHNVLDDESLRQGNSVVGHFPLVLEYSVEVLGSIPDGGEENFSIRTRFR